MRNQSTENQDLNNCGFPRKNNVYMSITDIYLEDVY